MTQRDDLQDLADRLKAFETRVRTTADEADKTAPLSDRHREGIEAIQGRAEQMSKRLTSQHPSTLESVRKEFESEWDALTHDFEQWLKHLDQRFAKDKC